MDERLKLTRTQKELAQKFNELCEEMSRAGIGFISQGEDVLLINLQYVDDWVDVDEMIYNMEKGDDVYDEQLADFEEMTLCNINYFYTAGILDDNMGLRFKKL